MTTCLTHPICLLIPTSRLVVLFMHGVHATNLDIKDAGSIGTVADDRAQHKSWADCDQIKATLLAGLPGRFLGCNLQYWILSRFAFFGETSNEVYLKAEACVVCTAKVANNGQLAQVHVMCEAGRGSCLQDLQLLPQLCSIC